ncbi:hypothetical protein BDN70DRAFT_293077 [Pholiota conissans]|uniref:Uncharacterized protein n=1 Tax=Pholiota conissans TaxID=109636 RepID=A0A9P6D515_9AGAR|nr:hypothetical protein BDN70DRAFT_293077 [Pholiota conissans]
MAHGYTIWPATSEPKLRKSSLRKHLPQLESMIAICKSERLRKELDERINSRKEKIASFYSSFAKTFLTLEMMPYLPSPELLFDIKLFEDYIDDPKEVVVDLIAGTAQKEILRFIVEFFSHKKRQLLELLLETDLLPEDVTEDTSPETFLGLALAAFECCGNAVFITWKEAGIHVCQEGGEMTQHGWGLPFLFRFSDAAYNALCKLSAILLVDPQSISANDLDTLNRRFVCKGCKFTRHALMQGLLSMTWRECLVHAVQLSKSPPQDQHVAEFDILTEDVTKSILAVEQPFPSPAEKNWCCRHCHIFSDPVKKAEAIAHARTAHSIKAPVSGKDFAYCATEHSPIRPRVFIGLDENSNHRCLRCPASKSLRLWGKEPALLRHLLDR